MIIPSLYLRVGNQEPGAPAAARGRGVVQVLVDLLAQLLVLVRLRLLHPEEHPLVRRLELQHEHPA